jgi:hypothetical protein
MLQILEVMFVTFEPLEGNVDTLAVSLYISNYSPVYTKPLTEHYGFKVCVHFSVFVLNLLYWFV